MHGDYASDVGHDGIEVELFAGPPSRHEGAGQWTEWREYGSYGLTIGFTNARMVRAGSCQSLFPSTLDITKLTLPDLEKLTADISSKVQPRYRTDGRVAEVPQDQYQVELPEVQVQLTK
jgi:hypothetical protein